MSRSLDAAAIARVFNATFALEYHVALAGGASEPRFLPEPAPHRSLLCFREDFAASALHEAAHWCIAGPRRRQLRDFGYWYRPPPRQPSQQRAFVRVEARVQALESLFADAAGVPFRASADDPDACADQLYQCVLAERSTWLACGLSQRSQRFLQALTKARGEVEI